MVEELEVLVDHSGEYSFWSLNALDVVQIVSTLLLATLAILTYRRARATIFSPIRTEMFKLQLASMTRVSERFSAKGEYEIQGSLGFHEALEMNHKHMLKALLVPEFTEIPPPLDTAHTYRYPTLDDLDSAVHGISRSYRHMSVYLPQAYVSAFDEIERMCGDPLLPEELVALLKDFLAGVIGCVEVIMTTMEELALESGVGTSIFQVRTAWIQKAPDLGDLAGAIVTYVRRYFEPDKLRWGDGRP